MPKHTTKKKRKPPKPNPLPWHQCVGVRLSTTAALLDCHRTKIYRLIRDGKLRVCNVAGLTLVTTESLIELLQDSGHPPGAYGYPAARGHAQQQQIG